MLPLRRRAYRSADRIRATVVSGGGAVRWAGCSLHAPPAASTAAASIAQSIAAAHRPRRADRSEVAERTLRETVLDLHRRAFRLGAVRRLRGLRLDAEHLGELARLIHLGHDVAAADQLPLHEQLRDRRPVGDGRQLLPDARVGEDVDGGEGRAERVERGHGARREAAARLLRRPLHEEDHLVFADRVGNGVPDGIARIGHYYSALVTRDRAWIGPPISGPNTA